MVYLRGGRWRLPGSHVCVLRPPPMVSKEAWERAHAT